MVYSLPFWITSNRKCLWTFSLSLTSFMGTRTCHLAIRKGISRDLSPHENDVSLFSSNSFNNVSRSKTIFKSARKKTICIRPWWRAISQRGCMIGYPNSYPSPKKTTCPSCPWLPRCTHRYQRPQHSRRVPACWEHEEKARRWPTLHD